MNSLSFILTFILTHQTQHPTRNSISPKLDINIVAKLSPYQQHPRYVHTPSFAISRPPLRSQDSTPCAASPAGPQFIVAPRTKPYLSLHGHQPPQAHSPPTWLCNQQTSRIQHPDVTVSGILFLASCRPVPRHLLYPGCAGSSASTAASHMLQV